jgi:hypothetical protein
MVRIEESYSIDFSILRKDSNEKHNQITRNYEIDDLAIK